MKCLRVDLIIYHLNVAPARERGLKLHRERCLKLIPGRSREGAWIEILAVVFIIAQLAVAPARERGLK